MLYRGARILILDEPTAVLVPQEVDELFANLRELKSEGLTVLFISHKLDEVLAVADEITVIRRGTTVATVDPGEVTARRLAELMVGSELPSPETRESTVTDQVGAGRRGAHGPLAGRPGRARRRRRFSIHAGEVLGIAGVEGNGQAELVEAIMGLRPASAGRVVLGDADLTELDTRQRREAGIGYIPEDRHRQGLLLDAPLWENRILGHQTRAAERRRVRGSTGRARARTPSGSSRDYDVRTPGIDVLASALSGGNQQKLIVGREMSGDPSAAHRRPPHPRRGRRRAGGRSGTHSATPGRAGLAVLLISADLDELIGLSDTLQVIYRGRLVADADPRHGHPRGAGLGDDRRQAHRDAEAIEHRRADRPLRVRADRPASPGPARRLDRPARPGGVSARLARPRWCSPRRRSRSSSRS